MEESWIEVTTDSKLKVPETLAIQIPKEEAVRVIVLLPENGDALNWERLTGEQFLSGYSESRTRGPAQARGLPHRLIARIIGTGD